MLVPWTQLLSKAIQLLYAPIIEEYFFLHYINVPWRTPEGSSQSTALIHFLPLESICIPLLFLSVLLPTHTLVFLEHTVNIHRSTIIYNNLV